MIHFPNDLKKEQISQFHKTSMSWIISNINQCQYFTHKYLYFASSSTFTKSPNDSVFNDKIFESENQHYISLSYGCLLGAEEDVVYLSSMLILMAKSPKKKKKLIYNNALENLWWKGI